MKSQFWYSCLVIILVSVMVISGCQPSSIPTTEIVGAVNPDQTVPPTSAFKACLVTDTGGINDKSFNTTTWKGIEDSIKEFGIEGKYLESKEQADYEKNIEAFIEEGCDILITVGFLLGDATQAAAEKHPGQKFSIVDYAYDQPIPNVLG